MTKRITSSEEIVEALNSALSQSSALDGDCCECRVRRLCRVTESEAEELGRNWNIDMTNGECEGECNAVLVNIASTIGEQIDCSW